MSPLPHTTVVRELLRQRNRLVAYLWTLTGDHHLAEDLFQDLSSEAVHDDRAFADEAHLRRWLRQVARFRAIDALKRRQREPRPLEQEVLLRLESAGEDDWTASDADDVEALRDCLDRLSPYARALVRLRYGEGLSGATLAARLGRQLNTVYVALSRAHRTLGECVRVQLGREAADA